MKLDYELVRQLLFFIEDKADAIHVINLFDCVSALPDIKRDVIYYHLKYLVDAHLAEGRMTRDEKFILDITPLGREYLDNIRDDNIWSDIKHNFQQFNQLSLDLLSDIGRSLILKSLGL